MFYRERMFIDTTTGPRMVNRLRLDIKKFLTAAVVVAIIVIAAIALFGCASALAQAPTTPEITETPEPLARAICYGSGRIVFEDFAGNTLAYVDYASDEQVTQIKALSRVDCDESLIQFNTCLTQVEHYILFLDNVECFMHNDENPNIAVPTRYDPTSDYLEEGLFYNSSEAVQYLYSELNNIFNVPLLYS